MTVECCSVDRGVTFFDTAEVGGLFINEELADLGVAIGEVKQPRKY
jgi:aryl-alcohol dehydrogenase-like predicted oxidoreductase